MEEVQGARFFAAELLGIVGWKLVTLLGLVVDLYALGLFFPIAVLVLKIIRWHLDSFWAWFQVHCWMLKDTTHLAPDAKQVVEGVNIQWNIQYGEHPMETVHIITPAEPQQKQKVIFYIHGGGFMAANNTVLLHSMTGFGRCGYEVYSFGYPKSPEARFPTALVSMLKALDWISKRGVSEVTLVGDSAGGNLVVMTAALVCNRKLLHELSTEVPENVLEWQYPHLLGVISLYGLHDQQSYREKSLSTSSWLEKWLLVQVYSFCFRCYRNPDNVFGNKMTLAEIHKDIDTFPRTLLVGASRDPLLFSSVYALKVLRDRGVQCKFKSFKGYHGFFGFPPEWTFGTWKQNALPAFHYLCDWLKDVYEPARADCSPN